LMVHSYRCVTMYWMVQSYSCVIMTGWCLLTGVKRPEREADQLLKLTFGYRVGVCKYQCTLIQCVYILSHQTAIIPISQIDTLPLRSITRERGTARHMVECQLSRSLRIAYR